MRLIDADSIDYDDYWHNKGFSIRDCQKAQQLINEQPTVEAIPIPDNATNGDMIKAMFPNVEVVRQEISSTSNNMVVRDNSFLGAINRFHADWWNALYKRGNVNGSD